ncbi:MAG: MoaD/ThiS family protein [Mycobacterium leprae]
MGEGLSIRLEVYLPFRGHAPWRGSELVPPGTTAGDLPELLGLTEPELAVLVNGRRCPPERPLRPDDAVAVLRPMCGG